jgi:hypothetical protein
MMTSAEAARAWAYSYVCTNAGGSLMIQVLATSLYGDLGEVGWCVVWHDVPQTPCHGAILGVIM